MSPQEGEDQMFGPPPAESVYWSQPGPAPSEPQRNIYTRGNVEFAVDPSAKQAVMQLPGLAAGLMGYGQKIAEAATQSATVPGARYEAVLTRAEDGTPQVAIQPANPEAEFDEAAYSTLTAAMTTAAAQGQGDE